ncbi:MAG: glutamate-5-semialdehyde dehydrogenase [Bacillota bacterium]|nr:glutamate-5-semialdehyde dehydrogenase [Bacillota bacterium]MDW7677413.1 glutamate-5-semialdehyde dehydrogenase [Bacillota bacterium]
MNDELHVKGNRAKEATGKMAALTTEQKNNSLLNMADALDRNVHRILTANQKDMHAGQENGLTEALLDRLLLTEDRVHAMAAALRNLTKLEDPVGKMEEMWKGAQGIEIGKMRVPLGVIGIIYEARPNVTVDAAGLCLKTGNVVILRGGSDAQHSNRLLTDIIAEAAEETGCPAGCIQSLDQPDREVVMEMLKLNEYIDVVIPRGGAGLIQAVVKNATVPVIETGVGNCHIFVDRTGNLEKAQEIVINAKVQRPGVCNALETLLVHRDVAAEFLPVLLHELGNRGVEIRGDEETRQLWPAAKEATEEDYRTEFLDLILAVKVVTDLEEALSHIHHYSTGHSEAIITEHYGNARKFTQVVDSAAVYVNASTRFTDGEQFGYGAEIGISTQKLHARGPMGLKELTSTKYVIHGDGQIRK